MKMTTTYKKLKARQRKERDTYSENLGIRVHRALSWLNRSEQSNGANFIKFHELHLMKQIQPILLLSNMNK